MSHRIVIDPVTGKAHTEDGPSETEQRLSIERQRRELKDMIAGNVPFHVETPEPPPPAPAPETEEKEWYKTEGWGYFLEETT